MTAKKKSESAGQRRWGTLRRVWLATAMAWAATTGGGCGGSTGGTDPARPEQTRIAFISNRDGSREIYVMDADGANPTRVTNNALSEFSVSFSPDGSALAFDAPFGNNNGSDLYRLDVAGTGPTRALTDNASQGALQYDRYPVFSAGGKKIVFAAHGSRRNGLFLANADGTQITPVKNSDRLYVSSLALRPDGRWALFSTVGLVDAPADDLYVMRLDGTGLRLLTDSGFAASYSPDGKKIVFASGRGYSGPPLEPFSGVPDDIYVMDADGTNVKRLTDNPASDDDPVFSPDGTKILFTSRRDGNAEIYRMNADGSEQTNLTQNPAEDESPAVP